MDQIHEAAKALRLRSRFKERAAELIGPKSSGKWAFFPREGKFVEAISMQMAKHSPTKHDRLIVCLEIYERELFLIPEREWRLFREGHEPTVLRWHARNNPAAGAGGLLEPDDFAVMYGVDSVGPALA